MFSNFTVALIFSIGASAWIYAKLVRSNGGQAKQAAFVAGALGLLMLAFIYMLLSTFFK